MCYPTGRLTVEMDGWFRLCAERVLANASTSRPSRGKELAAVEQSLVSRGSQAVILAGAPGVGKTQLAREVLVLCTAREYGCARRRRLLSLPRFLGAVVYLGRRLRCELHGGCRDGGSGRPVLACVGFPHEPSHAGQCIARLDRGRARELSRSGSRARGPSNTAGMP